MKIHASAISSEQRNSSIGFPVPYNDSKIEGIKGFVEFRIP
ncbi:hypothetical protein [Plebeiibacterium sediminum]|uniref:Uncharacterized protein n=1 Tax=Plebeiibacterium sediminum TaxID=2992112 RepID=A0AAE3M4E5_9BACT|nr:hypothetical protein [Plebeiobacterium sediminum]MCW3786642.1 hypothetical protein [Plebeiobacterium sediminum]